MFSQLYAKSSCPDIYLIPIQANTAKEDRGVSFDLNNTVVKITGAFNAKRNTRFLEKYCATDKVLSAERLCHLQGMKVAQSINVQISG